MNQAWHLHLHFNRLTQFSQLSYYYSDEEMENDWPWKSVILTRNQWFEARLTWCLHDTEPPHRIFLPFADETKVKITNTEAGARLLISEKITEKVICCPGLCLIPESTCESTCERTLTPNLGLFIQNMISCGQNPIDYMSHCGWQNNSSQRCPHPNRRSCEYVTSCGRGKLKLYMELKFSNQMAWRRWDYPELSLGTKTLSWTGTPLPCLLLWYQSLPLTAENKSPCVYFLQLSDRYHLVEYVARYLPWGCGVYKWWYSIRNVRKFLLATEVAATTSSFQGPGDHVSMLPGWRLSYIIHALCWRQCCLQQPSSVLSSTRSISQGSQFSQTKGLMGLVKQRKSLLCCGSVMGSPP